MSGLALISSIGIGHVQARLVGSNEQNTEQLERMIVLVVLLRSNQRCPSQISSFLLSIAIAFINALPVSVPGINPAILTERSVLRSVSADTSLVPPLRAYASALIKYISPVRKALKFVTPSGRETCAAFAKYFETTNL